MKNFGKRGIYVPDQGDIIWVEFDDPPTGHEQGYHRRAIVISPMLYNRASSKAIVCPITTKIKGRKFEVVFPDGTNTKGVVLSDEIKNIDWKARCAKFIEKAPPEVLREVVARLSVLFPFTENI